MEFAFIIEKMPWIGVFWHAFIEKENEFLFLLCVCYGMNEQLTCPILVPFRCEAQLFLDFQV